MVLLSAIMDALGGHMKNRFYVLLLILAALVATINIQNTAAYQNDSAPHAALEQNTADSLFQAADILFDNFNADGIYKGIKELIKLPDALNFWDKPFMSDLGPKFVELEKAGVKAYQDPIFLEKSVGQAYTASQDTSSSEAKAMQFYPVKFTSPTTFEVQGNMIVTVAGNKLNITDPNGNRLADMAYAADSDDDSILHVTVTEYEENNEKETVNFEFKVTDKGFVLSSKEETVASFVIDGDKITFDVPKEENRIEVTLNREAYSIDGIITEKGEQANAFSATLNPVEKTIGLILDEEQLFSAAFDAEKQMISVTTGDSTSELRFEDATNSIFAVLPEMQMVARLRFEAASNSLAVDVGEQATEMMEMFNLSVDKAARGLEVSSMGYTFFSLKIDGTARTLTITDPEGKTQVIDEAGLIELLNSTTNSEEEHMP